MPTTIKLNELQETLDGLDYPATVEEARAELGDVHVQLADGETTLGETLSWTETPTFDSADELEDEIFSVLPREAVGEPYQSEGEG